MPLLFHEIPDWISWENQGANIAVADLDDDGAPEVIALRVDHPQPGPNRGFYRVGRGLDAQGTIGGGWGPWIEVPDWDSDQNQGAGLAVADFGAQGLGLIVFQVRHVEPAPILAYSGSDGNSIGTAMSPAAGPIGSRFRTGSPGAIKEPPSP
jgi:hypothetical protein